MPDSDESFFWAPAVSLVFNQSLDDNTNRFWFFDTEEFEVQNSFDKSFFWKIDCCL